MKVWLAQQYAICCQQPSDDWGGCIDDMGDDYNDLYNMLIAADIACRNNNRELMRQILEEFYRRLFGDRGGQGYGLIEGDLLGGGGIQNVFPVFDIDGEVRISAVSTPSLDSVRRVATLSVHGTSYFAEAAGPASTMIKAQNGFDPLVTVNPTDSGLAESSYSFDGGVVGVRMQGVTQQHAIQKGIFRYVEIVDGPEMRCVPSEFKWELDRNGEATTVTLDKACPFNEVVFESADSGVLQMGVVIDSESEFATRIEAMGTVWITLPFIVNPDGSFLVGSDGWVGATGLFPLSEVSEGALVGPGGGNPPPPPNGRDEACADADGDGVRDGANELINLFDLSDCD